MVSHHQSFSKMAEANLHVVKIKWSIKGYHHFKIKPPVNLDLLLDVEDGNPYDPYAVKVLMPRLDSIPAHMRRHVTREPSRRNPRQQTVEDVAGQQLGRVPANLCKAFRLLWRNRFYDKVVCRYLGEVGQSTNPHVNQGFVRNPNGQDQAGGGAEAKCEYVLHLKSEHFRQAMQIFETCIPWNDLDERFFI